MVDASRQGALQGGLGAMNSIAAIFGPLIAAQSLAFGSQHGFIGAAFLVAGLLIGAAALFIALGTPRLPEPVSIAAE
jgi:DHA1 family tetracycline resistance protein-like MFS transporter